ncbi:MAG: DNA-processing protein DprA [Nocardioidaceae bacterium]
MNERHARLVLGRATEPGDHRVARLVERLGPAGVVDRLAADVTTTGERSPVAEKVLGADPERELAIGRRLGLRYLIPGDEEWPSSAGDLAYAEPVDRHGGAPLGLWVRGEGRLDELTRAAVAVVGSRSATAYGADLAQRIGYDLGEAGVSVLSGAAFGIDYAAHRGALGSSTPTIAVLACGADRPYPSAHAELLRRIAVTGVVLSEQPPGTNPSRLRFLARNRLIAALGRGTVVVEAALRSGALSTANWTGRLNRALMGCPGPVTSVASTGVHELIRAGRASLVVDAGQVLEIVSPAGQHALPPQRGAERASDGLAGEQLRLLDALPVARGSTAAALAHRANLTEVAAQVGLQQLRQRDLATERDGLWRLGPAALRR